MNKKLPLGKLSSKLLKELFSSIPNNDLNVVMGPGIGRDAAGITMGNQLVAVTTDPITFTAERVGTYCVNVNINDIACLGCRPRWFTVNILLPEGSTAENLRQIWNDINLELRRYHIVNIGGHTEVTATVNSPVVVGQMFGYPISGNLLNPSNGCPGDRVLLWQKPAIEGTAIIATNRYKELQSRLSTKRIKAMMKLLEDPGICIWPFVEKLVPTKGLVALHDPTEGGLASALHELADAASCGINVNGDAIPILPETTELAKLLNFDPLGLLASGCLLILCRAEAESTILEKFPNGNIVSIGKLTHGTRRTIQYGRKKQRFPRYNKDEIINALQAKISA